MKAANAAALEIPRDSFIGDEHEFFNDAVGDVALAAQDSNHFPLIVKLNQRLGQIEINRAACVPAFTEDEREIAHEAKIAGDILVAQAHLGVAFDHFVDVGVGHSLGGTNDAGHELGIYDLAFAINLHQNAHHEAINLRIEGADAVRKFLGKHRDGAQRKVDGCGAEVRFVVEGRAARNVIGDIGNMDLKLESSAGQFGNANGVVEIARCFAVNRHDRQSAKVASSAYIGITHLLRNGARFGESFVRENVRKVMLADDDFGIHAHIAGAADDFSDAADWRKAFFGKARELDVNDSAVEFGKARAFSRRSGGFGHIAQLFF